MKVEIRCPGCRRDYLVAEEAARSGVQCPSCSTPMGLSEQAPAIEPAPTAEASPPQTPAEQAGVVCPRCHLHFTPRDATPGPPARKERRAVVLIVEDLGYFRQVAEDALSPSYDVRTATSVAAARTALQSGAIDLMVLDLNLEGGDKGVDLLRGLGHKPCPILIYTSQDESELYGETWDELSRLGADDMVQKGMQAGEILTRKAAVLLGEDDDGAGDPLVANTVTSRR